MDINKTIINVAKVIIAQINPTMPRTMGNSFFKFYDIDYFLHENRILEIQNPAIDEITDKIAEYATRLIENGSTINLGLGKIAFAIPKHIINAKKKDLAVYSEVVPESIIELLTLQLL